MPLFPLTCIQRCNIAHHQVTSNPWQKIRSSLPSSLPLQKNRHFSCQRLSLPLMSRCQYTSLLSVISPAPSSMGLMAKKGKSDVEIIRIPHAQPYLLNQEELRRQQQFFAEGEIPRSSCAWHRKIHHEKRRKRLERSGHYRTYPPGNCRPERRLLETFTQTIIAVHKRLQRPRLSLLPFTQVYFFQTGTCSQTSHATGC